MNPVGNSMILRITGEQIVSGGSWQVFAAVRQALQGAITITGITNADGSPAAWVLPAGTAAGVYAAPGSGGGGGGAVWYAMADAADADKVIAITLPVR